jgi:hypothetical protein
MIDRGLRRCVMIVSNRTDVAATGLEPSVHHDEDD